MQTQSPKYTVKTLTKEYLQWFVETAAVSMLCDELKRPELVNLECMYPVGQRMLDEGSAFIAYSNGVPVGALGALFVPNLFNNKLTTLAEVFWYVIPKYRDTRAGLLLLKAFENLGEETADDMTLSTLPSSLININTLEKRGFRMSEFGFRKGC